MMRRGVTLIELMVAMFVATIVAYLAFDLIRSEQSHYSKVRAKVRLQDDAREAIRVIEEDLMNTGYNAGLNVATSAIHATLSTCALDGQARVVAFNGTNGESDQLRIRSYEASPTSGVTCPTTATPNIITYYVDATDSSLKRSFIAAGSTTPTVSTILKHVVTFQLQAGIDASSDPAGLQDPQDTFWIQAERLKSQWSSMGLNTPTTSAFGANSGDSQLTYTGWTQGTATTISNAPLARSLNAYSTYQVKFYLVPTNGFRAMFDTTSTASYLRLYARTGSGSIVDSTNLKLPAIAGPTWVSWQFQTGSTAPSGVYLQLATTLSLAQNTTLDAPTLGIANLGMHRVKNTGLSYTWANPDDSAADGAQRRQTVALRVWLLARSAKGNKEGVQSSFNNIGDWKPAGFTPQDLNSYVVYERVIPVGNHGY
jgi:prepilin-type N-terminal cleavage/methylation domain-containing protein